MQYLLLFLEGMLTFVSPCLLPMLPVYVTYFAAGETVAADGLDGGKKKRVLINALGFVLGFTLVFVVLGALAGSLGGLLRRYALWVNLATGLVVVVLGLNFLGVLKIGFLNRTFRIDANAKNREKPPSAGAPGESADSLGWIEGGGRRPGGVSSSLLLGLVFSVGWTPCVGAFLGSALSLASERGSVLIGMLMLLIYSAGLGLSFVVCAVLIDSLKGALGFLRRHSRGINIASGLLLVVMGVLMATGVMGRILAILSI